MSATTKYLAAFGRVVIGAVFLMSGFGKIGSYDAITGAITKAGLPLAPVGFGVALAVEIGLGLALLVGFRARWAAFGLAIWCLVTAAFFHSNFADQNMMIHFLKNVMIAAGLLQIVHFGVAHLASIIAPTPRSISLSRGHPARSDRTYLSFDLTFRAAYAA